MAVTIRAMRNNLGTSDSPYYALASWSEVVESEAFIDRMAAGRTTLSKTDILAVFQLAREELARLLAEGCYVKTPLGAALPVASGRFRSPKEPFLPHRRGSGHLLRIAFHLDPRLEAEALASLECIRGRCEAPRVPRISSVAALPPGAAGEVRAGGLIQVGGMHLRFNPADERLGLFFEDGDHVERRTVAYASLRPSAIVAVVPPELPEGEYRLILRSSPKGKESVEGVFAAKVSVRAAPRGAGFAG